MIDIKAAQEFEYNYNINIAHYINEMGEQRVKRTLTIDGKMIVSEDFNDKSQEGSLRLFTGWIDNAYIQETSRDVESIREPQPQRCSNLLTGFAIVLLTIITILLALTLWRLMS